jgi:thioredoxin-like negative regulator of GroEL
MNPIIDKIEQDYQDTVHLIKVETDLPHNEDIMNQFGVQSLPTYVLIDEADQVLGKIIGAQSEEQFKDWINGVIATSGASN